MSSRENIKRAMGRSVKAVALRPATGIESEVMRIESRDDGLCKIVDGDQRLTIDLSETYGGGGTTPSAGFYVRAALGACLAQGYRIWAAYLDIPVERIDVELHTAYDMRGHLGIDEEVPASYTACRYVVEIASSAPRDRIMAMLDRVDEIDFVRDIFAKEIPLEREVRISKPAFAE
jgi:uncharacterized OsmC-like protein